MRKAAVLFLIGIFLVCGIGTAFAKKEFEGVVQAMPEKGHVGEWKIDGRTVYVTEDTEIKEEHGKMAVGAYVEVEGVRFDGKFIAYEIETEERK